LLLLLLLPWRSPEEGLLEVVCARGKAHNDKSPLESRLDAWLNARVLKNS